VRWGYVLAGPSVRGPQLCGSSKCLRGFGGSGRGGASGIAWITPGRSGRSWLRQMVENGCDARVGGRSRNPKPAGLRQWRKAASMRNWPYAPGKSCRNRAVPWPARWRSTTMVAEPGQSPAATHGQLGLSCCAAVAHRGPSRGGC